MQKRIMVFLLLLCLTQLSLPYLHAGVGLSQQQILERIIPIVREKLRVPAELDSFSATIQNSEPLSLSLQWGKSDDIWGMQGIFATCDEVGRISHFAHYNGQQSYIAAETVLSREEAVTIATRELLRICSDIADQLASVPRSQESPSPYNTSYYSFFYPRLYQGVEVEGQGVSLSFDTLSGNITYLNRIWDDQLSFLQQPDQARLPEELLSLIEMEPFYATSVISPELEYASPSLLILPERLADPYPAYRFSGGAEPVFDAVELELIDPMAIGDVSPYLSQRQYEQSFFDPHQLRSFFVPHWMSQQIYQQGWLKGEELAEKVCGLDDFLLEEEAQLYDVQYFVDTQGNDPVLARLTWHFGESDPREMGYVDDIWEIQAVLEAVSGELIGFTRVFNGYRDDAAQEQAEGFSERELQQRAEVILSKLQPQIMLNCAFHDQGALSEQRLSWPIALEGQEQSFASFNFIWTRRSGEEEVICPGNGMEIALDALNGKVVHYEKCWSEAEFPDWNGTITAEEAFAVFREAFPLELIYRIERAENGGSQARLCYRLSCNNSSEEYLRKAYIVEAQRGGIFELRDNLHYRSKGESRFSDLDAGWSAKAEQLIEWGRLPLRGLSFDAGLEVSQAEYLRLLGNTASYWVGGDAAILSDLVRRRIIDLAEYEPEAIISEGQAVHLLLKMVGHAEVIAMPQRIFRTESRFTDEWHNEAALAAGLGLIDSSTWQPERALTRRAMLDLLYRYYDNISKAREGY